MDVSSLSIHTTSIHTLTCTPYISTTRASITGFHRHNGLSVHAQIESCSAVVYDIPLLALMWPTRNAQPSDLSTCNDTSGKC